MKDFEGDDSLGGSDGSPSMTSDEANVVLQALEGVSQNVYVLSPNMKPRNFFQSFNGF